MRVVGWRDEEQRAASVGDPAYSRRCRRDRALALLRFWRIFRSYDLCLVQSGIG